MTCNEGLHQSWRSSASTSHSTSLSVPLHANTPVPLWHKHNHNIPFVQVHFCPCPETQSQRTHCLPHWRWQEAACLVVDMFLSIKRVYLWLSVGQDRASIFKRHSDWTMLLKCRLEKDAHLNNRCQYLIHCRNDYGFSLVLEKQDFLSTKAPVFLND